ncbi:MAG: thiaminase II [Bryobacteraceae bacterium]
MWSAAQPVYERILRHPFLLGLADGTLPRNRFEFYLVEDSKYLRAFGEALRIVAAKAPRAEWRRTLERHADEAIEVEREMQESLLKGIPARQRQGLAAPSNYAYTNHLLATAARGSFSDGLAALLPCYWIYWEVGKGLQRRGSRNKDYQRWIDQYADPAYGTVVREVLGMMDTEAQSMDRAAHGRAIELFLTGSRYEYMFWDMAWRLEQWAPDLH